MINDFLYQWILNNAILFSEKNKICLQAHQIPQHHFLKTPINYTFNSATKFGQAER